MSIAAVTKDYLVLHFSEFAAEEETRIDALNETALLFVDENVFGTKSRYVLALVIAHMLKMSAMQGTGNITSISVGDVSESYASGEVKDSFDLTSYGRQYKTIAKQKSICARPLYFV